MIVRVSSNCFKVECDQCGAPSKKSGFDHGEAADNARDLGFKTVQGGSAASPRLWLCLTCLNPQN